jgi:hypothetical protein
VAKKHLDARKDRYFQLHHYMMKTDAWRNLSPAARAVYLQIGFRYDGSNNGKIAYSVRDAAGECNLDKGTASRAFRELFDRGFIEETRHGGISKKTRLASEWRLTAFKCDLTGALKTCAFMHRGGSEYSSHTPQKRGPLPGALTPSPVRINSRECPKQLPTLYELTPDQAPECPKQLPTQADFEPSPVRNNYPHIVYQSVVSSETALAGLPPTLADGAVGTLSEIGNLATHDHPEATRPSRFRSRRAGALSFERWGQVKPDPVKPDPAPAKRPRRAGGLSQARWCITPDTASNSQRPLVVEALPPNEELPSNAQRADSAPRMVDVSAPHAPTSPLVN